ncbi:MAG TPA: zf-HC2 domain-containing protein [Bryobacteraceae bacterium]|nr:zf-HC2 domain-containing protein [Bryobacteraceae bacterium]
MSCSPFDLKDYIFGELSEPDRAAVSAHVEQCAGCREELDRLQLTATILRSVQDEDPPRRIAFVSDRVFEPRWWQTLWNSAPRLGFASAALVAAAIVAHAFLVRPVPQPQLPVSAPAAIEARIGSEVARRVDTAVRSAVAESEARQNAKSARLVEAMRQDFDFQRRADRVAFEETLTVMQKRYNMVLVANNDIGGRP